MWMLLSLGIIISISLLFLANKHHYSVLYSIVKTFRRDLTGLVVFINVNLAIWRWNKQQKTVAKIFKTHVDKHPEKVAFYFEDEVWTFLQVEEFSNKIGRFFLESGFTKGDHIALLLESRPEYACIWLGLSKIGVVTSLINTNLANDPLIHSIKVVNNKAIIFGSNHMKVIENIQNQLGDFKFYQFNETECTDETTFLPHAINLRKELKYVKSNSLENMNEMKTKDKMLYIYTSGTTGLPKAAVITHSRYCFVAYGTHCSADLNSNDIIYTPLPLYHSAGGMLGIGQTFLAGNTIVIRKKFSASNYWLDCNKFNCTVAQYIGEICRYLLTTPRNCVEIENKTVKKMLGNGLRPQIWSEFVKRFRIEQVYEFYGATEGICNLINMDNTPGAIGFVPKLGRYIYPVTLVKCNPATGEPIKNERGYCIECNANEPGLLVAKVDAKNAFVSFDGYANKKATSSKLMRNVFRQGDLYFNSGDVLEYDELDYFYFKDRTGDTFRWKGENVSTSEIEAVISNIAELKDAAVYGVSVPNTEGKVGMAAIVDTEKSLDLQKLCDGFKNNLPSYAIPMFVRIMCEVPLTGTFKIIKIDLREQGYDVDKIKDDIYFYDAKAGKYILLDQKLYNDILNGKIRF